MSYILTTTGLTKKYGEKLAADRINIHIKEGEIYGLIGRNGAGKTTIMRMISGLSAPTSGSYEFHSNDSSGIGVLIESPGIYANRSAFDNLKIKCIATGMKSRGYVEEILKTVGLENTDLKKPAGSYSLGMRQRLGIGLALVGDPKMLVLDEPINGLDPQGIAEIRQMLVKLRDEKGITIMISSHILDELAKVADCFGIINDGTLLDEFTSEELHQRSGQFVRIRTSDNAAAGKILKGIGLTKISAETDGTLRVSEQLDNTPAMAKAIVEASIGLQEISLNSISLEDYYLGVTEGGRHNG